MKALTVLLFFLGFLLVPAAAEKTVVSCDITGIAVAADGSGVWFTCSRNLASLKRTVKSGQTVSPYVGLKNDPSELYWLPSSMKSPERITSVEGYIGLLAAPSGSQVLVVMPQERSWGQAVLYERQKRMKELPVDAAFLLWSADSHWLYFYGGSTIQADAWNIIGIYELKTGKVTRIKLNEPTEVLNVCPANGNVYSVTPQYAHFAGKTLEYTSTMKFVRQIHGWVGAHFSARCTYVASESSYHGPLPWTIYNVKTSQPMLKFSAWDDDHDTYALLQWNPKHDSILLREYIPKGDTPHVVQVFDVSGSQVLQKLPNADAIAWSADGNSLIVANRNTIDLIPANLPSSRKAN
jgi:hypothetical protein